MVPVVGTATVSVSVTVTPVAVVPVTVAVFFPPATGAVAEQVCSTVSPTARVAYVAEHDGVVGSWSTTFDSGASPVFAVTRVKFTVSPGAYVRSAFVLTVIFLRSIAGLSMTWTGASSVAVRGAPNASTAVTVATFVVSLPGRPLAGVRGRGARGERAEVAGAAGEQRVGDPRVGDVGAQRGDRDPERHGLTGAHGTAHRVLDDLDRRNGGGEGEAGGEIGVTVGAERQRGARGACLYRIGRLGLGVHRHVVDRVRDHGAVGGGDEEVGRVPPVDLGQRCAVDQELVSGDVVVALEGSGTDAGVARSHPQPGDRGGGRRVLRRLPDVAVVDEHGPLDRGELSLARSKAYTTVSDQPAKQPKPCGVQMFPTVTGRATPVGALANARVTSAKAE